LPARVSPESYGFELAICYSRRRIKAIGTESGRMAEGMTRHGWLARNRIALLAVAVILFYGLFVQWIWGWPSILAAWQQIDPATIALALALLVGTYVIRAHRMQDYFRHETTGRFLWLFRVTQIHNLLNIMLPFRAGETSFPLLMRSEFGVPLVQGTSALLVLRLLDLHALLAAGGIGLLAGAGYPLWACGLWVAFLVSPLVAFPFRTMVLDAVRHRLPARFSTWVVQVADGMPPTLAAFVRAWVLTVFNWGIKIVVLGWVLGLMGVAPIAACFGAALGGELSSVLPMHAPGGVGTYPAGIAAGASAFGAGKTVAALATLAKARINTHLLMIVSALAGTGISLVLPALTGAAPPRRLG